jgi:hypothetical protein
VKAVLILNPVWDQQCMVDRSDPVYNLLICDFVTFFFKGSIEVLQRFIHLFCPCLGFWSRPMFHFVCVCVCVCVCVSVCLEYIIAGFVWVSPLCSLICHTFLLCMDVSNIRAVNSRFFHLRMVVWFLSKSLLIFCIIL